MKLVFGREDRRLLGVHILGDDAAELIHIGQAVLLAGGTIDYFIHSTFNVPTLRGLLGAPRGRSDGSTEG